MKKLTRKQIIAIILKRKFPQGVLKAGAPRAAVHSTSPKSVAHRFLRRVLQHAPVERTIRNPHGGAHGSYVITLKGGQKAKFKPLDQGGDREYLAYLFTRQFGMRTSPTAVLRKVRTSEGVRFGMAQQWVREGKTAFDAHLTPSHISPSLRRSMREMRFSNFVLGNADDHLGNFLVTHKQDRAIPIDLGEAFTVRIRPQSFWDSEGYPRTLRSTGRKELKEYLKRVDNLIRRKERTRKAFENHLSQFPKMRDFMTMRFQDAFEGVYDRANFLQASLLGALARRGAQ